MTTAQFIIGGAGVVALAAAAVWIGYRLNRRRKAAAALLRLSVYHEDR